MDQNISQPIIDVKNLTKRFKNVVAVNDISFRVERGEVFALLGPNGAGKTTLIKILTTLLPATGGEALIDGHSAIHNPGEVRKVIGYVPQMISVDGALTAYENLVLMARLYDVPARERKEKVRQILTFLKLDNHTKVLVKNFSGGMIRKLEVGQAMLHHPRVLFLDEPTTGLDPVAKRNVWERLLELRKAFNTTILFSTHNMEEAQDVCDRVAIMSAGKIVAIGTPAELKVRVNKLGATLEDAFVFFTGNHFQENGDLRDVKRARQTVRRLG